MKKRYWTFLFILAGMASSSHALPTKYNLEFFNCVAHNKQHYITCNYRARTPSGWLTHFNGVCPEVIFIQDKKHAWKHPQSGANYAVQSNAQYAAGESK